jgi:hypothetical protein
MRDKIDEELLRWRDVERYMWVVDLAGRGLILRAPRAPRTPNKMSFVLAALKT